MIRELMNPLLVDLFGVSVCVNKSCLQIKTRGNLVYEFEARKIPYDLIVLHSPFGSISIESLNWLSFHNIPVLFMKRDGKILSQILPSRFSTHGNLRLAQFRAYENLNERMKIARALIQAKTGADFSECKTIRQILMKEARIDLEKWNALKANVFDKTRFRFEKRSERKFNNTAMSEINALLNYAYSILECLVRKSVLIYGLDSSIGFLHEIDIMKEPLVYDLEEPFRKVSEDSVCQILPKISKRGFYRENDYSFRIRTETAKILLERLSDNLQNRLVYNGENRRIEGLIFLASENLSQYLLGKRPLKIPNIIIKK
jgi:CRISPR-associated protein Cas1